MMVCPTDRRIKEGEWIQYPVDKCDYCLTLTKQKWVSPSGYYWTVCNECMPAFIIRHSLPKTSEKEK